MQSPACGGERAEDRGTGASRPAGRPHGARREVGAVTPRPSGAMGGTAVRGVHKPFFSTFGFSDNQYLPSCFTKPKCREAHWGKEKRGSWGLTRLRIPACRIPSARRLQHPRNSCSQEHTPAKSFDPPPPRGVGVTSQADHKLPEFRHRGLHPSIPAGLPTATHSSTGHDRLTN